MPHPRRATRAEEQAQRLMSETGMIPPEITDYMTWRMMEELREEADDKTIRIDTRLEPALNKTNAQIVDAICHGLGIPIKGQRKVKVEKIAEILTDPQHLGHVVDELPDALLLAVKRVLDAGGWMPLDELTEEFGDQEGDGWFWNEKPPASILGQLRVHGLLLVGQAAIKKVRT